MTPICTFYVFLLPILAIFSFNGVNCAELNSKWDEREHVEHVMLGNYSEARGFQRAAVTADAPYCAEIAKEILRKGGKVGDATIAGLVCTGCVHPHTSGIGGGFLGVHYDAATKKSTFINARERAPLKATEEMYDDQDPYEINGGEGVAVPGEIAGYIEIYKRFGGGVKWAELFEPTIKLLNEGFRVSRHFSSGMRIYENVIQREESLKEVYVNKNTNRVWREGDSVTFPVLAQTLEQIAKRGGEQFYSPDSGLGKSILEDLQGFGAIITREDFIKYRAKVSDAIKASINIPGYPSLTMHTASAPASGALMTFVFRILANFRGLSLKPDDGNSLHILMEAFKMAYGRRGKLGDPDDSQFSSKIRQHEKNLVSSAAYLKDVLNKIDLSKTNNDANYYMDGYSEIKGNGTAAFAIISENGDAMTITTTVNSYFGSRIRSRKTGIVFNNQMQDFSTNSEQRNANSANKIAPGKRPLSSACPVIFTNSKNQVVLSTGAAGGLKIIAGTAFVSLNYAWYGKSLEEAVDMPRLIHTLDPMTIQYERNFDQGLIEQLKNKGHEEKQVWGGTVTSSVGTRDKIVYAASDNRKGGSVAGY